MLKVIVKGWWCYDNHNTKLMLKKCGTSENSTKFMIKREEMTCKVVGMEIMAHLVKLMFSPILDKNQSIYIIFHQKKYICAIVCCRNESTLHKPSHKQTLKSYTFCLSS